MEGFGGGWGATVFLNTFVTTGFLGSIVIGAPPFGVYIRFDSKNGSSIANLKLANSFLVWICARATISRTSHVFGLSESPNQNGIVGSSELFQIGGGFAPAPPGVNQTPLILIESL